MTTENNTGLHDLMHEQSILSACIRAPRALRDIDEVGLRTTDFATDAHRDIFSALLMMREDGTPISVLTLSDQLAKSHKLDSVGGHKALTLLAEVGPPTVPIKHSAERVLELANKRRIADFCYVIQCAALDPATKATEVLSEIQSGALRLNRRAAGDVSVVDRKEAVSRVVNSIGDKEAQGSSTGFSDVDAFFRLSPGRLYVVAARPAMGKSALAAQIGAYVSDHGTPSMIFSLEMPSDELIEREMMVMSRSNRTQWEADRHMHSRAVEAAGKIADRPLHIIEDTKISIRGVESATRALVRREGVGLLIVDYLQLIDADETKRYNGNRVQEVGDVSKGLKQLAMELKIPVIAVCQLSRKTEEKEDGRPLLSHLRDSGQIEQDADVVSFVYRPEYYMKEKTPAEMQGIAFIDVAKNRGGKTGTIKLKWTAEATRFDQLARNDNATRDYVDRFDEE